VTPGLLVLDLGDFDYSSISPFARCLENIELKHFVSYFSYHNSLTANPSKKTQATRIQQRIVYYQ